MQFSKPTSKSQMYNTLQDIFYYYRIRRESWEGMELEPLIIPRLKFELSSENDLMVIAKKLATPSVELKEYESIQKLVVAKSQLAEKVVSLGEKLSQTESDIAQLFDKQEQELSKKILKLGAVNSTIEATEINKLRSKQNEELTRIRQEYDENVALLNGEIQALEEKIEEAQTFFKDNLEKEIYKKIEELRLDEIKRLEEVNKYNNSLDEKELKYANDIILKQANLDIKYRELNQEFFTKDQLIEMGYYTDVINCICGYYNTLAPMTAYQDFMAETKVMIYLEDYYTDVLYMYRARAGQ